MMIQRLDHDYCEDTDTEQIGGIHNLIWGLIQYVDTATVIGYGNRIGQMIMSGPDSKFHVADNTQFQVSVFYGLRDSIDTDFVNIIRCVRPA
jgi:hypothetical protein